MQVEVVKKGWENNSDLSELSIRELLELEGIIIKLIIEKIKVDSEKDGDWKKDFLDVSEWSHLKVEDVVKVDRWPIEAF